MVRVAKLFLEAVASKVFLGLPSVIASCLLAMWSVFSKNWVTVS